MLIVMDVQPTSALIMPECEDGLLGCVTWCTLDRYANSDGRGDRVCNELEVSLRH